MTKLTRILTGALLALVCAAPLSAQTRAQLDSVRAEVVRADSINKAASAQLGTALVRLDSVIAAMPVPSLFVMYGGDGQTAGPGQTVEQSISVRVTDSASVGIDGDTILWSIVSGGGSLNKSFEVTYSSSTRTGWSGARWTLGQSGVQQAKATHKKTGREILFSATLTGVTPPPPPPSDTVPQDTVVIPPPPAPPVDTLGLTVVASCDFNGTTLCGFHNVATAANTPCNFNGVAGQCSSSQWLLNGKLGILYERLSTIYSIDANRSIESPDAMVPHGGYLYAAASFFFPSIPADARQRIDSAAAAAGVAAITDLQHEDALKKLFYMARQLGPNGGGLNHAVLNFHGRVLRFTPGVKFDSALGQCVDTGTSVYNFTTVPRGGMLDRWWRVAILIKRSSGPMVADGEVTVWLDGVQFGPIKNVCTNRDSVIQGFGKVSVGQQYQFNGFYSEMRLVDDAVVGKK
jgi:hypothetical protein